jgi:hypothetical protein
MRTILIWQNLVFVGVAISLAACAADERRPLAEETGSTESALSVPAFCANYPRPLPPGGWDTTAVRFIGNSGRLQYLPDPQTGHCVPEFGSVGYMNGAVRLPTIAGVETVLPGPGDDTPRIQAAIDKVGRERPIGPNGYRGAVVLGAGEFQLDSTLRLNHDGVVLRGAGRCGNSALDTTLVATGTPQVARVVMGSGNDTGWNDEVAGSRSNLATSAVAGDSWLAVVNGSGFAVDDTVVVVHPITQAWIDANDGGETGADDPWRPNDLDPILYKRRIKAKFGNALLLDAPVYNDLDLALTTPYVAKLEPGRVVARVGIENLRVDNDFDGTDRASSIEIVGAEDAWVKNVVTLHFGFGGVRVQAAVRVTVQNVDAFNPTGPVEGGRMYNFVVERRAQLVLFVGCRARNGRHHFASNGITSASGVVFYRSISEGARASSEGHRRWSQGLLYDNIRETGDGSAHLGCRGAAGTGHGWAAAHSVLWNYKFDDGAGYVERPPTAQNWAFGAGPLRADTSFCPGVPAGHIEQHTGPMRIDSLYEAQLCQRLDELGGVPNPPDFTPPPACPVPPDTCQSDERCCEPVPGGCNLCVPLGQECF